jgi:glycosyltransferase involved in cell wall biosynthesis
VVIIPTVVNTETVHNGIQEQRTDHPAVGWTGSFSTLPYLDITLPVLKELQEQIDFEFVVIADKDPQLSLKRYRFIRWSRQSEMADLLQFHIGIMPLHDDEISRGKCGFKAIQYMSLGIPAVVSPVGVNTKIVQDGVNGFVCATNDEWKRRLGELLRDPALRERMGLAAHASIEKNYSVKATGRIFLDLFN